MRQPVYIVYDDQSEYVAKKICDNTYINGMVFSEHSYLTDDILTGIARKCKSEYFYVIRTNQELLFPDFDFAFKPQDWDAGYIHIWNNDMRILMYNSSLILQDASVYSDDRLKAGKLHFKNISEKIYTYPVFDIVFISYDEEYADTNYRTLQNRFPRALRTHGVKGIFEAHKAAAKLVNTDMFYVVDADAEILPNFEFNYQPHSLDRQSVHVWHSRNPVNDLEYGYGGVKLFPTKILLDYAGSPVDFTTNVSKSFKVMEKVSNITKFNTDPFSAWRSGFRECAKLASKIIPNQDNSETEHRLSVWCTNGEDREFGDFAIMGAKEGAEFGRAQKDQPDMLGLINDFSWLEKRFSS
jgi:hypothetical protein